MGMIAYPPMEASGRLTRMMIDRLNRDRASGASLAVAVRAEPTEVALPRYAPDRTAYPAPSMTHREAFGLFGDYLERK